MFISTLIIIVLLCVSIQVMVYASSKTCELDNIEIKIPQLSGTRLVKTPTISTILGYPAIGMKIDKPLICGYYEAKSVFGKTIIIVGRDNNEKAYIYFPDYHNKSADIDDTDLFFFTDLRRLISFDADIIKTFNIGCCQ